VGEVGIRLGYVGFRGDVAAWRELLCDIYGLQFVPHEGGARFRTDERLWRIAVEPGAGDPLAYLGLEIDSDSEFDDLGARLAADGYSPCEDKQLATHRNVSRLFTCKDPDGTPLEFYLGGLTSSQPFVSGTGARFVTGRSGLGHVLLSVSDLERGLHFYEQLVGFRRSDVIEISPGLEGYFLNGGHRHHVVAIGALPSFVGLHHIYLEVDSIPTVGRAWDKVLAGAAPIVSSLGQHANDPAVSFYVESPSGFAFEYGCGSRLISDELPWIQTRWDTAYLWGGHPGSAVTKA
jgi:3,4-dihydroxy-9,10-secoandrosta-1,3,5(10)-triene-9,17-dione 4,5-dioxygenase